MASVVLLGCSSQSEDSPGDGIVGDWVNEPRATVYLSFQSDGSWSAGEEAGSTDLDTGQYTLEDSVLTLVADEGGGCGGSTATYEVTFVDSDAFSLEVVDDPCPGRASQLQPGRFVSTSE